VPSAKAAAGHASIAIRSAHFEKFSVKLRRRVVLTRHKLSDGYSDDVLGALKATSLLDTRVLILMDASTHSAQEARQVSLGADCVQRDPVRTDVLVAYLNKYRSVATMRPRNRSKKTNSSFEFARANVIPATRTVQYAEKLASLTPREFELLERLDEFRGEIVTYEMLYSEIIGRRFRGDTSNMRVLLAKLDASFRSIGLNLRDSIEVIPKSGYRYL